MKAETLYAISSEKLALFDRKGRIISAPSTWRYQPPLSRLDDPITSKDAAERCKEFAGKHAERILDCLRANGPQIAAEIARTTGLD